MDGIANANDSLTERRLRTELALCYHLIDFHGWSEMIFNHISVRLPGAERRYLVNPFGLNYTEMTPDNLLTVDVSGKLVGESVHRANPAGFALHGAIHAARDDIHCIIHTHTNPISAVAQKAGGFSHDSFYGAQLFGRVGYHTFEGITLYDEERERMLVSLGDNDVLVLRNHGVAVGGVDVPQALMLLWTVQRAAEIQWHAGQIPRPDSELTDAVRTRCANDAKRLAKDAGFARLFFDGAVRRMVAARGQPF